MHLGPTDHARLEIFTVAELARRTLDRGLRLNAPEAIALVCDEMHMAARGGATFEQTKDAGRTALRRDQLLDGVPELVHEIRVEVLFDQGSRLVTVRDLWKTGDPVVRHPDRELVLSGDRPRCRVPVTNGSTRVVRVSSHYPFWRVNPRLEFDRDAAHGYRLDLPAGVTVRWLPGETHEVDLVRLSDIEEES